MPEDLLKSIGFKGRCRDTNTPPKSFCMLVSQLASNRTFAAEAATIMPSHGFPLMKGTKCFNMHLFDLAAFFQNIALPFLHTELHLYGFNFRCLEP